MTVLIDAGADIDFENAVSSGVRECTRENVCICVCVSVCVIVYVCICVCVHMHTHVCVSMRAYTPMFVR